MNTAPDRSGWRAALIGVSRYTDPQFTAIPAAANNVADLARLVTAPTGTALDNSQCAILVDPTQGTQVGVAVARAASEADDVLLVYYAGHGVVDRRGRLYLALTDTDYNHPEWSSVPFATLRDALSDSRARARILILDCCFSGRAFEAMSAPSTVVEAQIDIRGTYTITSSSRTEPSLAPEGDRHTAFTAALLGTAATTGLTLDQLYLKVDQTLQRNGHPRPQRRIVNIAGELRLFTPPDLRSKSGPDAELEIAWRSAAAQGDTAAMTGLAALLYSRGQVSEAHDWYREAAERGNADAMNSLATLLHKVKHLTDAETWWRRAAATGNTDAMHNLAVMLDKSFHLDEALIWYRRAAEAGSTDAMHNLAIRLRYRGQLDEAGTWWRRAGHDRDQRDDEKPRGTLPLRRIPPKTL